MKYKNTFQKGISMTEREEYLPAETGVSVHRGAPKTTAEELSKQGKFSGIPMPGPGMVPDTEDMPPAKCVARTKKGNPCRAYAVSNSLHCYGHNR